MRIAFLTPEYAAGPGVPGVPGGTANHLGRACTALAAAGHEVAVFVPGDAAGTTWEEGVEIRRVATDHLALTWLNRFTLFRLNQPIRCLAQSYALNQACGEAYRERPFDVIQYTSYGGVGFFRPRGVPSVMRVAGYQPLFQAANRIPATLASRLYHWMFQSAIRRADAIFCPSRSMAEIIQRELGKEAKVIEPPFPPPPKKGFGPEGNEFSGIERYLLTFGRLTLGKGVDIIAGIIRDVLAAHPDLHWVFIGKDGNNRGRSMMAFVLEQAGPYRGRVHHRNEMPRERLFPIVAGARAVVLPSRMDNLPNTCLEAMALERVVVGTRGASFDQLIEDGQNGFLCDIDSPESLREVVERALALPDDQRGAMGALAARRIEELRPEKTIPTLVAFYEAAIGARRSG